jgi:hypothetical protein
MSHHSAEWLRGAVEALERGPETVYGRSVLADYRALLAEAEAREAGVPTAADLAVADELDMLAVHIQEYIGPDDARDDIRRICRNRAADLRRGVKRGPTAAAVSAPWRRRNYWKCGVNGKGYDPARAAEVLRGTDGRIAERIMASAIGADALEFLAWLFSYVGLGDEICVAALYQLWHGEDSFLDYARAEWEKERKG